MTYEELKNAIDGLTAEQKQQDVTLYVKSVDEFYPLNNIMATDETVTDVLDNGHIVLTV